ncbi:MAG TPA: hypothetical protein VK060_14585 [Ruania sp.]|nr:hypothetical protein [Ruania sp.]
MISSTYRVSGMVAPDDARVIKDHIAGVPGVGAVATEIRPDGESVIILKHQEDAAPDRAVLAAALQSAGHYTLG